MRTSEENGIENEAIVLHWPVWMGKLTSWKRWKQKRKMETQEKLSA